MKTIKLSDFYPYDRNKGGIQELHHKIESKTLQYWGEDSGIWIWMLVMPHGFTSPAAATTASTIWGSTYAIVDQNIR